MGKSKKGGVFGYLRGKVGGVTYSIMSAANSKSGKKEQIVRALPDSVANPQTISQVIQRMKSSPAHRFYAALSELQSNAFEGVKYGNASRLHFLSLAMKMNGPYIQKSVDRFIPAVYPFTRGSLPSIGILAFDGGATKFATDVDATAETFAAGLGVSDDTQFTLCIVRNNAGLFTPEYIPFETRMKLSEVPTGGIIKEDSSWKIVPSAFGFDDTNIVAIAVAISKQQADGSWLRSEQDMVISNQLEAQLYSQTAMNAAIASYQDGAAANSVNSAWYYNLGLNQAFNGQVVPMVLNINGNSVRVLMGITQVAGRPSYTIFATSAETTGNIIEVNGRNCVASTTTVADLIAAGITYPVAEYSEAIAIQAGLNNEVTSTQFVQLYLREVTGADWKVLVDREGRYICFNETGVYNAGDAGHIYFSGDAGSSGGYLAGENDDEWPVGITTAQKEEIHGWGYHMCIGEYLGGQMGKFTVVEGEVSTEYRTYEHTEMGDPYTIEPYQPVPFA